MKGSLQVILTRRASTGRVATLWARDFMKGVPAEEMPRYQDWRPSPPARNATSVQYGLREHLSDPRTRTDRITDFACLFYGDRQDPGEVAAEGGMVRWGAMRFLSHLSALSTLSALVPSDLRPAMTQAAGTLHRCALRLSPMPGGGLRRGPVSTGARPERGGGMAQGECNRLARLHGLSLALRGGMAEGGAEEVDGEGEHEAEAPPLPHGDEVHLQPAVFGPSPYIMNPQP